jgi:hypothetical protein
VVEAAATPAATTQPAPLPPADVTAISPAVSQQANPPDSKPQNLQSNRSAAVDSPAPQPVLPRRRVGRVILISVLAVALITASLLVFFNWRDRNNSVPDSQDSKATSAIANYGAASQTPSAEPTAGQPGATTWSLQREFISGDCSLVVIELESGLTDLVGDGGWTPQNGQFVSLQVAVTYHGAGEGHFPPEDQVLTTSSGRTYQPDTSSAEKMGQVLGLNPLQPEQAQVGYLVFDIAKDEQPTALEFKSDLLSEPVQIPFG